MSSDSQQSMLFLCADCRGVHIVGFWVLTPCSLVSRHDSLGRTFLEVGYEDGSGGKMSFRNSGNARLHDATI